MSDYSRPKKILAKNLKRLLFENDETRIQLARALGVHESTVDSWVNAISFPRVDTLQKLATHYNITISQLTSPAKTAKEQALTYIKHFSKNDEIAREIATFLKQVPPEQFVAYDHTKLTNEQIEQLLEKDIQKQQPNFLIDSQKKSFPEKLRLLRKKQDLSLKQLANKLESYYNGAVKYDTNKAWRLEHGLNEPTLTDIQALSNVLCVPIEFFANKKATPIDLSNDQLVFSWKGQTLTVQELQLVQAFVAGIKHDSNFKIKSE